MAFKMAETNIDNKKTILVAEDLESNYFLVECILRKEYKIERAVDGVEAVERFHQLQPDLILMDMRMPRMSGLEATKEIRKTSSTVPIIALTANAFSTDKELAKEAGCTDYLSKPLSNKKLREVVSNWLKD